jgi:hypothetical protein
VRSDRWIPIPGESDSTACDATAGALVPCWPRGGPLWFDLAHENPAGVWEDQTATPQGQVCVINQAPRCPLAAPAPGDCLDLWRIASPGQTVVRFEFSLACADVALNGASLWDPDDYAADGAALFFAYPLDGRDQIGGVVEVA